MSVLLAKTAEPQIQRGHRANFTARTILRRLAAAAIVLTGLLVISVGSRPTSKDYISYWSAGRLLLHRADPYSASQVLALEKSQGYSEIKPIIMRNPPWALLLVVPLGFGNPVVGLLLWTIAAAGCILIFIRLLNVSPEDRVFAFLFAPALGAICSGQSSPFLLLGFSLFLHFFQSRPFLAGASLLLMAIKPHLFLVFWMLLLVDCIYRRRFFILVGGTCVLVAGSASPRLTSRMPWRALQIAIATVLALLVDLGNYTQFLYLIGSVFIPLFAVAIADFFVVSKMRWDVSDTAPFRWQPTLAWVFGFVAYQLVNPGTVKGWSPFWLDVQQWVFNGNAVPGWLGATYTSIIVSMLAAILFGRLGRSRRAA